MARKKKQPAPAEEAELTKVSFDYIKSNYFRIVHVDGFIGGPTPDGDIIINVWNQRAPIPDSITQEVNEEGHVVELRRTTRDSIVREMEVGSKSLELIGNRGKLLVADFIAEHVVQGRKGVLIPSGGVASDAEGRVAVHRFDDVGKLEPVRRPEPAGIPTRIGLERWIAELVEVGSGDSREIEARRVDLKSR